MAPMMLAQPCSLGVRRQQTNRRMRMQSRTFAVAADAAPERKAGPLQRGGEKPVGSSASGMNMGIMMQAGGLFQDPRWIDGNWDIAQFKDTKGETDWDAVIDAESTRRRYLEAFPEVSTLEDEVKFDTNMVPWWAWVRRFHLPEAEKINGRAAMVGFATGYLVDCLTHAGLVAQTDNFLGKTLMWATFLGCAFIRNVKDLDGYKGLLNEATFYDKQWNATWEGFDRPSEKEK